MAALGAGLVWSAMAQSAAATFTVPITYYKLPNGLKVALSRDTTAPLVVVGVYYNIGFRIEPRNRTGFAHLFEHLMFEGSKNLAKGEFDKLIEGNGGVSNGSTRFDFTNYFEVVPSHALETMLWGEADRMKNLTVTEETLKNQQGVVGNEVKVNVINRPYGGFPWLDMPQYANKNWFNAHNFYGDLKDIEAATLSDAKSFSQTYYSPNNAALALVGDFDEAQAKKWVEKYFGSIPASKLPPKPDLSEPRQEAEQRFSRTDKLANKPALGIAYQMPPRLTPEHYAMVLLDQMLIEGDDSLLTQELVKKRGYHRFGGWRHQPAGQPVQLQRAHVVDRQHDPRCEREARSDIGGGGPDHRSAAREAGDEGVAGPFDGEAAVAVLPVVDAVRRVRQGRPDGELCAVRRQPGADQQPGGQSAEGDAGAGAEDRAGVLAKDQPHGAGGGARRGGEAAGGGHGG